ncbi:MAG TPA: hypothetical protein VGF38_18625, partial [Ktedonobacterales bacterium]
MVFPHLLMTMWSEQVLARNISSLSGVSSSPDDVGRGRERDVLHMGAPEIGGFRDRFLSLTPSHLAVVMALAGAWILAGCSVTTGATQSSVGAPATSAPTNAPTSISSKINDAMSNTCPVAQAPQDADTFRPDITLNEDGGAIHTTALHPGQRLEIRLDSQIQWGLRVDDPQHILVGANSQGW